MLAIDVKIEGDKALIEGLNGLDMPQAIKRGMSIVARGVHRNAMDWLNGPGRSPMRLTNRAAVIGHASGKIVNQKSKLRGQVDDLGAKPGSYPVPSVTGNLKRLLDFVDPGQTKSGNGHTFTAGPMEAIVYDSAEYASVIHEGTGSSAAYGRRAFLNDAFEQFNLHGQGVAVILEAEIQSEIAKRGLA